MISKPLGTEIVYNELGQKLVNIKKESAFCKANNSLINVTSNSVNNKDQLFAKLIIHSST